MSTSAPSTTSYVPLDSNAPSVFSTTLTHHYTIVGFIMLVLYDHAITLDKEVEWIWTLRWRLPKIIFLINRYLLTSLIVLGNFPQTFYPLPISFCKFNNVFVAWSPIFNFSAAELLMIIRVSSLYSHSKLVIWSLSGLFLAVVAGTVVAQVLFMRTYSTFLYYEFLPGCFFLLSSPTDTQWHDWLPALSIEGILMLLTVYKVVLSYRSQMNRAISVLARDSVLYFLIMFVGLVLTVACSATTLVPFRFIIPTQCITSIAVGRMMMNIRGLILDDPEHTTHLRTLEFVNRPNSGSEIEESSIELSMEE